MKEELTRRALLLPAFGLLLLPSRGAHALPPLSPSRPLRDLVKAADAVCIAKAERYVFRGLSLGKLTSAEDGRDFDEDSSAGYRTLDVILRVREWFYGAPELRAPLIRVNQPLGGKTRDPALMHEHLYLLSQGTLYTGPTGTYRALEPIAAPLPIAPRTLVTDLLKDLQATGEKR